MMIFDIFQSKEKKVYKLFNEGVGMCLQGDDRKALGIFNKVLEIDPNHVMTISSKASCLARLGKPQEAAALFKKVVEMEPDRVEEHRQLGLCYLEMDDLENCKKEMSLALKLGNKNEYKKDLVEEVFKYGSHVMELAGQDGIHGDSTGEYKNYRKAERIFRLCLEYDNQFNKAEEKLKLITESMEKKSSNSKKTGDTDFDVCKVKKESEKIILDNGGKICEGLPLLESKKARYIEDIEMRAKVMILMMNIGIGASSSRVHHILRESDLLEFLSESEKDLLNRGDQINERDRTNLHWYIESLWGLMWALKLVDDIDFFKPADIELMFKVFSEEIKVEMRSDYEIYKMLDLYYRLNWLCVETGINEEKTGALHDIKLDGGKTVYGSLVVERRKALTWVMNSGIDWDHVDMRI